MRFHHLGIATKDIHRTAAEYQRIAGLGPAGPIIPDEAQGVRVAFATLDGECFLEFVEPLRSGSPIDRILEGGGGPYHTCFEVLDLDEALRDAREAGAMIVSGPKPAPAFHGKRVAFVYFTGNNLVEYLEQ